ncbi:MAG: class I SAM-dependent methyltransferase [Clostridiales bacterium]|nr:class I SAM-dependent methyltransferase [Clostridiales bacterium]
MKNHCISCGKKLPVKPLFVLEDAPASAQDIPDAKAVKTDCGMTLGLYQCETCGLVQFDCEPVSYYRDVIRAGGFTTTMTGLRREQYQRMIGTYGLKGKKFIEVGCGRGEFIKVLTEFPVQVFGMEHKADLVDIARDDGLHVWQEFPERADQIFEGSPYDVFLSFNFLEHQPDPSVMLQAIYHNLTEEGMGLVTVPALEYIVEQGSYYELIRDHIAYYSLDTLRNLLERNGFRVLEEGLVNRDTIAMTVKKMPHADRTVRTDREEVQDDAMARSLQAGYYQVQEEIDRFTESLAAAGRTLALWGAGHQGFTLAATTKLGDCARYIIDSAPFKQGRFAPASHLPIVPPEHFYEEPVDAVLIVAPGYTDEIAGSAREKFGDGVCILAMRTDHIEVMAV